MNIERKKSNKVIIGLALIVFLFLIFFSFFQNSQIEKAKYKEEFKEKEKAVEEYNQKVKKWKEEGKYQEAEEEKPEFDEPNIVKREIMPYTEPLPPVPDPKLVKEQFIDQNNNGVRDDIEVDIVQDFEEDRDLVEAFFTQARLYEYFLYLAENDLLDRKNAQWIADSIRKLSQCSSQVYKSSFFKKLNINSYQFFNNNEIDSGYFNSKKRKFLSDKIDRSLHGIATKENYNNKEACQAFFQETQNLIQ